MDVLVRGLYQVGFRWKKRKERRKEEEEEEKKKILGGGGISDIPGCLREDSSNGCMQTLHHLKMFLPASGAAAFFTMLRAIVTSVYCSR